MAGVWRCVTLVMVVCVCLWESVEGRAVSRPKLQKKPEKPKEKPIDNTILPAQNINIEQMAGTWYLVSAASKCSYLLEQGTSAEATVMTLTLPTTSNAPLSVRTTTRLNHQCWEILQVYTLTPTPGRLLLKGSSSRLDTDIVVLETDYGSYAVLSYQKQGKLTMKLYGRSKDTLSENILDKFEELAEKKGLGLAYVIPFPNYSHCEFMDKDHVINCVPTC